MPVKVGDLVQYVSQDRLYSKWFYSHLAEVQSISKNGYCRVKWLQPVIYYDNVTVTSDFAVEKFEVVG